MKKVSKQEIHKALETLKANVNKENPSVINSIHKILNTEIPDFVAEYWLNSTGITEDVSIKLVSLRNN